MINLSNKELVYLQKFASASIIEKEDGTFVMSPVDTSSIYLSILSLNREEIKDCSFKFENQEKFYTFNTSMFNEFIEKYKQFGFKFADNIKQGQAGNISLSYLTIKRDSKIINQSMFNIIQKSKVVIVFIKDSNKYYKEINSIQDWDNTIKDEIKDFKPIRLFIRNVSPEECCTFYLKPINAYLNLVYKSLIDNFIEENNLINVKSKEIREKYGIDLSEYLQNVSNNNFLIKVDNNQIIKIYLVEKTHLFFTNEIDDVHFYDDYSFVKREYQLLKESDIFEKINPLDLYSKYNHNNNIDPFVFFNRKEQKNIHDIIKNTIKTSKDVIVNKSDESILKKLSLFEGNIFEVFSNRDNKYSIRIKDKNKSTISVSLFDRQYNRFDNFDNQVTWFTAINDGLSFEREKTLSVFYVENFVEKLIKNGHKNISIELEKPISKKDGRRGFLDFVVTSTLNDEIYGQVIEFKAVYNWENSKSIYQEQADNYDITSEIIDKYNIKNSYDNRDHLEVELLNLI